MPPSHPAPPSQDSEMEMAPRSNASSSVPPDEFSALEDDDDKYEMYEKVFIKKSNLQAQVTGLNDRIRLSDLMQGQNAAHDAAIKELQQHNTTLHQHINGLQQQNDAKIKELQQQNAALREQNTSQRQQNAAQDSVMKGLQQQYKDLQQQNDAKIKELQQQNAALREQNTSQRQQNAAQNLVMKGLQQEYKELQQQNDAKIKELQQQNAALREQNTNQQIQNAAAINVLQQQNAILQQQTTALQQENTRLQQDKAHQNTVIKGLERQNALLQVHNQVSARRYDSLAETLQNMQARLDEMSR